LQYKFIAAIQPCITATSPLPVLGKDNEQELALPLLPDGFFACDTHLSFSLCGIAGTEGSKDPYRERAAGPERSQLADPQHRLERRHLAVTVLHQVFDFREMSRRSLGENARKYSDRLEEFTPVFVTLLEQTYMSRLEENGNAKIEYVKERVDGDMAQVETKTKLKDGTEYNVNYKLNSGPTGWRVYDVIVEGVSIVNNYPAQFDRFLSKKSFDELLQTLREKKSSLS
jgi:phospholipid transport system substrate-binding protein